ncbi:MAG TPA: histidine kinase [Geobacter sp.]|nr:histidine kinase [Geobacter sp.]
MGIIHINAMKTLDTSYNILIVDDEEMIRMVMRTIFEELGFTVVEAVNGLEALEVFDRKRPDIVFTDLQMPEMDGFSLISRLQQKSPDIPIIVISGTGNIQSAVEAIRLGAWDYITKPIESVESLHIIMRRVIERKLLIAENEAYREHLEELVMQRTAELRDSEVRFRTLFESANDAIILIRDERIISCNRKTQELFGCSQDDILDRPMLSFSPLKQPSGSNSEDILRERIKTALSGEPQFYEWRYTRHSGEFFDAEISLNRLELQGTPYLQAIMRDITERKKAERALLDNARIKRELEIAQEVQQSLLPAHPPERPGLLVACNCVPASNVGGDYYDFFYPGGQILDAVIADVAGHNFGSALLMIAARSVLQAKVHADRSPGKLLAEVNGLLYEDLSRAELMLSMFYARLDIRTATLVYANAGHTRPLLFRSRDGSFEELDADGLLMGVKRDVAFEEKTALLSAGDILFLYTDGITEAENESGDFYGDHRFREVIAEFSDHHPEDILAAIFQSLATFIGDKDLTDDITITIMKIMPSE